MAARVSVLSMGAAVWKTTSAVSPDLEGECRPQNVRRLLRRRVARRELVLEVGPHDLGEDRDPDDGENPEGEDSAAAVVAGTGQASECGVGRRRVRGPAGTGLSLSGPAHGCPFRHLRRRRVRFTIDEL